jgi:iron complex outermembrane recepter protein
MNLPRKRLPAFLLAAFAFGTSASPVYAAEAAGGASADVPSGNDNGKTKKEKQDVLEEVVVTGSLIPQIQAENFTPITTITNVEIQERGFADVAEALQRASFSTGSVQNGQYSGGFTQGAKVTSFFGLDPSYTKYLLNGLPIANYPALYNGTENFVSISGIPTVLVDHIDILPGAQSSIYGSDAIAGVVNVVMKQQMDGPMIDARYGFFDDGGGADRRVAIADGFSIGAFNLVGGVQYDSTSPMWGYQRSLTSQYYNQGSSAQTAERDYLVYGVFGQANGNTYYFEDPANCANVTSQWSGTVHLATRADRGQYCGTVWDGAYTIDNGDEQTQIYLHSTYDLNDNLQIYGETLLSHDVTRFSIGPSYFGSDEDSTSPFSYYEDPRLGPDYLNLQHLFSPEESGGLNDTMDQNTNNSVRGTLGIKGAFGSNWKWLSDMTYTDNKLTESTHLAFTQPIEAFFGKIYGPQLGFDPNLGTYLYEPNYANFYKPITPAQYASFTGDAISYSYTEESLARAQINNSALFQLPGGSAGLALQIEGGDQGWNYAPDPRYLDNATYGYTATSGSGHRSRYAGLIELQMPIFSMLKANVSGRYDDYRVEGDNVDKATYNLGLEFRPIHQVLLRARYGTAFKAPTLADEFQGVSGYYETLNDYYTCEKTGYTGANLPNCPQFAESVFGTTSGNTKLDPITAKVWDLGFVVSPIDRLAVTLDYIHYAIRDEIASADPNKLLETEAACLLGQLDITTPSCVAAIADVTRNSAGAITEVYTPKENVSQENVGTFIMGIDYKYDAGAVGEFAVDASLTDMVSHTFQQYPGDPLLNYLNDPFYSTEFKTKDNLSVTWTKNPISITAYVERYGRSPNYISEEIPEGYGQPGAGTVAPWTLVDLSIRYQPLTSLVVSFAVNNAANSMPPADHSQPGTTNQPYDELNYNVYGREYYLTATYKLGR